MRQADLGRVALITFAFVALLVACNSTVPVESAEKVGTVQQGATLATGQACNAGSQCTTGFCVDTVCCDVACGNGARDNMVCSNIYTGVRPVVGGTCITLSDGDACGSLEGLNPCTWRGSKVNGGNNCPAPGNGDPTKACYSCDANNNTCPPGLPICSSVGGIFGCSVCKSDFASGGPAACPTAGFPVCETVSGACVECTALKPNACPAGKACDTSLNKCVSCLNDFSASTTLPGECPVTAPFCVNPGANSTCVPCKAGNEGFCPTQQQVCLTNADPALNKCVGCLTAANCNATGPNPTCNPATNSCAPCTANFATGAYSECPFGADTNPPPDLDLPACVVASGSCKECSATDETTCKLAGSTKTHCSNDAAGAPLANTCVECNVGFPSAQSDCPAVGNKFCDTAAHRCVSTCIGNADCAAPTPVCGLGGTCVECLLSNGNADCLLGNPSPASAGRPFCGTGAPQAGTSCVACRTSADCGGTTPVCDGSGTCRACNGNNDEAGTATLACPSSALPACKTGGPNTGACVECTNGPTGELIKCVDPKVVCDSTQDKCVACTSDAQCSGNAPVCDLGTNTCKGCTVDNGVAGLACPTPDAPACVAGTCFQCRSAAPPNLVACTDPAKTACNGAHSCVQCTSNAQCVGNILPVCDLGSNLCTAVCATNLDCAATPLTPLCKAAGGGVPAHCVQCLDSAADCGALHAPPLPPSCNPATDTCVECLTDAACGGTKPICNTQTGTCVPCDGDKGDGTPAACKSAAAPACVTAAIGPQADIGKCVQCTNDETSLCVGATPACNATSHQCVACGSNAQCSGNTPICNAAGTCVACNGDLSSGATAKCFSALNPACVASGRCAECKAGNLTACTPTEPVCDLAVNNCVQCNVNADCTGPNGVCNTQSHMCTLGCTTDANCTMAAPACKTPDNFCVQCTATNKTACVGATPNCDVPNNKCVGCNSGIDCPGATPVCDPVTKTCTATCTTSAQCPGDVPVCDPVSKTCVGCVTIADCKEPTPICNTTTHMCGTDCTKSSECPGSAPVCNPVTRKCVPCTSNSDCPTGQICNTTTNKCGTECSKSSECPGSAPICDPKKHECVGCVDDTSCPATAPLCDGATRQCVADLSSIEGGGCACSTVPSGGTKTLPVLVGLGLALSALARRRRRRELDRRA